MKHGAKSKPWWNDNLRQLRKDLTHAYQREGNNTAKFPHVTEKLQHLYLPPQGLFQKRLFACAFYAPV
jgi:hypothetical protein